MNNDARFAAIGTALVLTRSNSEELGDSTVQNDAEVFLLSLRMAGFDVTPFSALGPGDSHER